MAKACLSLLALLLATALFAAAEDTSEGSCTNSDVVAEDVQPKYKPSQAALTAFFRLHEPADPTWTAKFVVLEVTDGCPLNGMYRRFKHWISEGAKAYPNLIVKTTPGMDPILQFQAAKEVNQGDLGIARVDVSDLQIDEVEAILDRRGILKDEALAREAAAKTADRLQAEKTAREAAEKAAADGEYVSPVA